MSTILVTGGTGNLGALVVTRLRAAGHDVRVLSRHAKDHPVDLRDGSGLDAAMAGAQVVVHCASTPRGGDDVAAGHLIEAARRAGTVTNILYISIVGVDVVPFGYYTVKYRVERMLEASGLGVTILRTTQFHDLVAMAVDALAKVPVVPLPLPKGSGCSRSPWRRSPTGWRNSPTPPPPAGSRTWAVRRSTPWWSWAGRTWRRRGGGARCSRCPWRGRRTRPSAAAAT